MSVLGEVEEADGNSLQKNTIYLGHIIKETQRQASSLICYSITCTYIVQLEIFARN